MGARSLPTVTALVAAYNYERYVGRAVQSALSQDYPPELLDVVVVDDGSRDGTADVVRELAEAHPGRVTLIQQANAGATAALNRARAAARGELLGLLDADDAWLPAKTMRQVEVFLARPELSGVFCDMNVVDADEQVLLAAKFQTENPRLAEKLTAAFPGQFAQLLWGNVATHSSILVRAEAVDRIPDAVPYADWWCNILAAARSGIAFLPEPLALYRIHGANLTGGVSGPAAVREALKTVAVRFHALRHLDIDALTPEELMFVWEGGVERGATEAYAAAESRFVRLAEVGEPELTQAAAWLAAAGEAAERGDHRAELVAVVRALAWNPYLADGRARMEQAFASAKRSEALPDPLAGARAFVTVVDAEDLLAGDELLLSYADAMCDVACATLAIDATRLALEDVSAGLGALVDRCGLSAREDVDLVAFTGPLAPAQVHRVRQRAAAVYGDSAAGGVVAQLRTAAAVPSFSADTVADLRVLALS